MLIKHRSPIFEQSDRFISELAELSPSFATEIGASSGQNKFDDYSTAGAAILVEFLQKHLEVFQSLAPIDDIDRIAAKFHIERFNGILATLRTHERLKSWGVINSPVMELRSLFELMPAGTPENLETISQRMSQVGIALATWTAGLADVSALGGINSRSKVQLVIELLEGMSQGSYSEFALRVDPEEVLIELHQNARAADQACLVTAEWLKKNYLPVSGQHDGVGQESYQKWAKYWTGADLDLRETYEWGLADLKAINERMWGLASKIKPDAKTLRELADHLDNDPKYKIQGTDELLRRLREFTDEAVRQMDGVHFDIDDRIKFCDVKLAPEGGAAAPYYNGPTEDLSRPGTTWFPTLGKDEFIWWLQPSTWYHEAVPGHHLQLATMTLESERLSRYQRIDGSGGLIEGWALYAERFMDELGAYDSDAGIELGFLAAQAMRAARVVVDIGLHLGYEDPHGRVWNSESAYDLIYNNALRPSEFARSEVERYLAMPAQAISYKVGERFWMNARSDAQARLGDRFDMKKFHAFAFKLGALGLDQFAAEMTKWDGN
ncbi:MAG: DUF885 domain-containing protein [Actinomycetes bacterium]